MSSKKLTDLEKESLNLVLSDLHYLLDKKEILVEEIDNVLQVLKSNEVKSYIQNLRNGSKPEAALRESFIAGQSVFLKFLFGEAIPEVRSKGYVDYLLKDEMGRGIALELKPLFEAITVHDKSGKPILQKIKQWELKPEDYKEQIFKYIKEGDVQFVVLTDLKDWYCYSKALSPSVLKHFLSINLFSLIEEYDVIGNLRDYLERKEFESIRYDLDKLFLDSLKTWGGSLSTIQFEADNKRKLELVIGLINKFVFVQTLDDYGVIEFNWIKKRWSHHEQMWQRKGKLMVLQKFFDELDDWFFLYYDTELFKEKTLSYIQKSDENVNNLYRILQNVLGLTYLQLPLGAQKGIMQYNFRYIDEDILGKAYETFLAEIRKEEGVYYTPKFITQYIVENTVGKIFERLLTKTRNCAENKDLDELIKTVSIFTTIKILDPACGSGSFLIKAIKVINEKYRQLNQIIEDFEKQWIKNNSSSLSSLHPPETIKKEMDKISEIKNVIGPKSERELISRMLVRHIYGIDLDERALEVAKVNIWLEGIKLSPKSFRYDQLPANTNYILPDLEMNLCNGDSVIGLNEDLVISYLNNNYSQQIAELSNLRHAYVSDPSNPDLVDRINKIRTEIKAKLAEQFLNYLKVNELPLDIAQKTKPFHWGLDFWYVFFDENANILSNEKCGFDVVIGNPPYVKAKLMDTSLRNFLEEKRYPSATASFDLYVIFIEKAIRLLKQGGHFGFINPSKFIFTDYGLGIRRFIKQQATVKQLIDFGDSQIFDEATNYTCLLFVDKNNESNYTFRVGRTKNRKINIADFIQTIKEKIDLNQDFIEDNFEVITTNSDILTDEQWKLISIAHQNLLKKISNGNMRLEDLTYKIFVGLQITPVEVFALSIRQSLGEFVKVEPVKPEREREEYLIEKDLLVPVLKSSDIERYFGHPENYYVIFPYKMTGKKDVEFDTEFIEEAEIKTKYPKTYEYLVKKRHFLETREEGRWKDSPRWYEYSRAQNFGCHPLVKIITPGISTNADYALDEAGYYIDRGSYGIILNNTTDVTYKYLLALLNSRVLDFYLRRTSPFISGGYYSYQTKYMNNLPIKSASDGLFHKRLLTIVEEIICLKKTEHTCFELWGNVCSSLKNDDYSLEKMLLEDYRFVKNGEQKKTWTTKVKFYPNEQTDMSQKGYIKFIVAGEAEKNSITIYGLDENNKEESVFELEFVNRELNLQTYLSLIRVLKSKVKIETLSQLFTKTLIPIIREVNRSPNESTVKIITKLKDELKKLSTQDTYEKMEGVDTIKIGLRIQDLEAEIDALLFKLYDLNESDLNQIFDYLKTPITYASKILKLFKNS